MPDTQDETTMEEEAQQDPQGGADAAEEADEEAELAKLQAELYGKGEDADDADGGEGLDETAQDGDGQAVPMSKSQMKKKAKIERIQAKRAEGRRREKEAKAARRAETLERLAAEKAAMTEEQKEALREERQVKLQAHRDAERLLKEKLKSSLETGPRIVIDLDWEAQMTEGDVRHLAQQLGFSYSANKQVERPVHMMLTSFKGQVAATATKMISGLDKWFVTRTEQHYSELFGSPEDKARLVYLTADAEEELQDLDESKVYIIGGLVDHNRHKGICEQRARAAGIATARLPISRHVQLASRAVLTVNHVFQILAEYYNNRDWASVLDHVMPKRKRADFKEDQQQQQQGHGQEKGQDKGDWAQQQGRGGGGGGGRGGRGQGRWQQRGRGQGRWQQGRGPGGSEGDWAAPKEDGNKQGTKRKAEGQPEERAEAAE